MSGAGCRSYLDVRWFAKAADHRGLLTVKRNSWIVKDFFGLFQLKLNFIHSTVEEGAKEARYENTTDTFNGEEESNVDERRRTVEHTESFESIFQADRDG